MTALKRHIIYRGSLSVLERGIHRARGTRLIRCDSQLRRKPKGERSETRRAGSRSGRGSVTGEYCRTRIVQMRERVRNTICENFMKRSSPDPPLVPTATPWHGASRSSHLPVRQVLHRQRPFQSTSRCCGFTVKHQQVVLPWLISQRTGALQSGQECRVVLEASSLRWRA